MPARNYDVYADQLYSLGHGYALYEPDPGDVEQITIGDVGYTLYGTFHRLFNIFFPATHPINHLGVPEGFQHLPTSQQDTYTRSPLPPGAMCSTSVRRLGGGLGGTSPVVAAGASIELSCDTRRGAALLIKYPGYRKDAHSYLAFESCMTENYRSWLDFARNTLRRNVKVQDIVLVTGCDVTANWATAAFTHHTMGAAIRFQVGALAGPEAGFSFWGEWNSTVSIPHRCGPVSRTPPGTAEQSVETTSTDPTFNQCIFIRGYRVVERAKIFMKLKAAAEPRDLDDDPSQDELNAVVVGHDPELEPLFEDFQHSKGYFETICEAAKAIFEHSDADIALVHDDDLFTMMAYSATSSDEDSLTGLASDADVSVECSLSSEGVIRVGRIKAKIKHEDTLPEFADEHTGGQMPLTDHHLQFIAEDKRNTDMLMKSTDEYLGRIDPNVKVHEYDKTDIPSSSTQFAGLGDDARSGLQGPDVEMDTLSSASGMLSGRSRNSTRRNRTPCMRCKTLKVKCVIVSGLPHLCERCRNSGITQCTPSAKSASVKIRDDTKQAAKVKSSFSQEIRDFRGQVLGQSGSPSPPAASLPLSTAAQRENTPSTIVSPGNKAYLRRSPTPMNFASSSCANEAGSLTVGDQQENSPPVAPRRNRLSSPMRFLSPPCF